MGMYRSAADELAFSTNGNRRMYITASGQIVVDNANAGDTVLTLTPTGNAVGLSIGSSGSAAEIDLTGASPIINSTNGLTIQTSGASADISISPTGQTNINGAALEGIALLITPNGDQTGLEIASSGTSAEINLTGNSPLINAANDLQISIAGTTQLFISSVSPQVVVPKIFLLQEQKALTFHIQIL